MNNGSEVTRQVDSLLEFVRSSRDGLEAGLETGNFHDLQCIVEDVINDMYDVLGEQP